MPVISDGHSIHTESFGSGRPLILVHGFASDLNQNWKDVGAVDVFLAAGFRVIALDNRGHGQSSKPHDRETYRPEAMARDIKAVMAAEGLSKADLFGYSMGARISARATALWPEAFSHVVLGGVGRNLTVSEAQLSLIPNAMRAPSLDAVTHPVARAFRQFAESRGNDLEALAFCAEGTRVPVDPALYQGKALPPVLVITGSRDELTGPPDDLAAIIPGAEAITIEGPNHMTAPSHKAFQAAVISFLNRG